MAGNFALGLVADEERKAVTVDPVKSNRPTPRLFCAQPIARPEHVPALLADSEAEELLRLGTGGAAVRVDRVAVAIGSLANDPPPATVRSGESTTIAIP
jgi:hypothetical protein